METGGVKRLTRLSLLLALSLILFAAELQMPPPIPIPGVKLGLANIVIVYALYRYPLKDVGALLLARVFLSVFFGGSVLSLTYSLMGGMFCLIGMNMVKSVLSENRLWLCSAAGAVFHNIGQLTAASWWIESIAVWGYFPLLCAAGIAAGLTTGMAAQLLLRRQIVPEYKIGGTQG